MDIVEVASCILVGFAVTLGIGIVALPLVIIVALIYEAIGIRFFGRGTL